MNSEKNKKAAIDLASYAISYIIVFFVIDYAMHWIIPQFYEEEIARLLRVVIPLMFTATLSSTIMDLF